MIKNDHHLDQKIINIEQKVFTHLATQSKLHYIKYPKYRLKRIGNNLFSWLTFNDDEIS